MLHHWRREKKEEKEAGVEEGAIVRLVTVTIYPVETVHSIMCSVRLGRQAFV